MTLPRLPHRSGEPSGPGLPSREESVAPVRGLGKPNAADVLARARDSGRMLRDDIDRLPRPFGEVR